VVNLLRLLRGDVRGINLARLALQQAHLAGVDAQDVSLTDADLSQAVLTQAFSNPLCVSISSDGLLMAAGTSGGEVCLWRAADRTWDAQYGRPIATLEGHTAAVRGSP
jgi:hypothetical protein